MITLKEKIQGLFLIALIIFTMIMTVVTNEQKRLAVPGVPDRVETAVVTIYHIPEANSEEDSEPYIAPAAFVTETQRSEYPVAARVWEFLKEQGFSNHVAAGILGNFMCECAGQNLNLKVNADNGSHYGIAQWSKKYYPEVNGKGLEGQLNYLMSDIAKTFKTFGKLYKTNFTYQDFLNLTNEQDAALAFAKVYERCGAGSYVLRQKCATKAYEYFVGK